MLRILNDCIACGISVHPGDVFPESDFPKEDVAILIGLGYAERFTPEEPREHEPEQEPEQESPVFVEEDEPAPAKSRKKSKK